VIRVIIVDDDPLVAQSLKTLLAQAGDVAVEALGRCAEDAQRLYAAHRPDVAILDIRMEGTSGLEAGAAILERFPQARLLFLTTFSDDEYIVRALRLGAKGYLLKQDFESLLPALRAVVAGQRVFGDDIVDRLPRLLLEPPSAALRAHGLSEREEAILAHLARGLSNKEISDAVFLSEGTVRNYVSAILEKLGLRDRTQLAIFYYRAGAREER